jgi:hypothetical protein
MFVKNESRASPILKRGYVTDELAIAALVVPSAYRVHDDRLELLDAPPDPVPSDPPDTGMHVMWEGVSVTAAGTAHGPPKAPYVQPVSLRAGEQLRRLVVFGDRVWSRQLGGGLAASAPAAFEGIELSFARAFGGGWDVPPGLLEGTDLPHPGYRRHHLWNPGGVGYYPDAVRAAGAPLPNIERPDQLVQKWNDAPDPGGFTPCSDLLGFRMRDETQAHFAAHAAAGRAWSDFPPPVPSPRMLHHAPPDLILADLPPGAPIELVGVGERPLRLAIPSCPVRAEARGPRVVTKLSPRLRAVHVNADQQVARVVYDFSFRYDPRRAPLGLRVADEVRP